VAGLRTSHPMQEQVRLLFSLGHTIRSIAKSEKISRNTVRAILREAPPSTAPPSKAVDWLSLINWEDVHEKVSLGATIKSVHARMAPAVTYKSFWHAYRSHFRSQPNTSLRLRHNPGERMYFDFADGIDVTDAATGKKIKTQLLVATLPFSSLTTAEFVSDQKQRTLIPAIERAFRRIGGVTPYVVVDNLKSAVQRAHLYDPNVNQGFVEFANHMGFAVLPARPYTPRDKAAVEAAVGVIQRQFYQDVRDHTFYSLQDLNERLKIYLEQLNSAPMKDHAELSRRDRFTQEAPLLKSLPTSAFELSEWRTAKVHPDCHVQIERRFYSVPYQFVGHTVHVCIKTSTIEIFSQEREPLALHPRIAACERQMASTIEAHYPEQKAALARFDVQTALRQAERIGPHTHKLIEDLLSGSQPLKYLRRAQGVLRLHQSQVVSTQAMEHACERALLFGKKHLRFIKDTALFFAAHGGKSAAVAREAPRRHQDHIYLHNQPTNKE